MDFPVSWKACAYPDANTADSATSPRAKESVARQIQKAHRVFTPMKRPVRQDIQTKPARFIGRDFFMRDPVTCARELIGCELRWKRCGGTIVETEAYSVVNDAACHTFSRPSSRRFVAVHPPGAAYIYLNYGVHWLLNFLVKGGTEEGFVLIRALEPRFGIPAMRQRRGTDILAQLCSGPGKLTRALGIDGSSHGLDFFVDSALSICASADFPPVCQATRIGISKAADLPWRFLLKNNPHVSTPKAGVFPHALKADLG